MKMTMSIPFEKILNRAYYYRNEIYKFTRDLVRIPCRSGDEGAVADRVKREMEKLGFAKIMKDGLGNVLGYLNEGKHLIAMDGHMDVVSVGDRSQWKYDPYEGYEDEEKIIGLGACDMKGGLAAIIYGAKIIKDLDINNDFTLLVTGTVAEEACDGLCWKYLIEEMNIRPEFVLLAEPSDGKICYTQKGRMSIFVSTKGKSVHGSIPEEGDNAIYKMADVLKEVITLNDDLHVDGLLGKGSLTISKIESSAPSICAVADSCTMTIDRRLTWGETPEQALDEIRGLPAVKKSNANVGIYYYDTPAYTGLKYGQECSFKAWKIAIDHVVTQSVINAYKGLFKKDPEMGVWPISTNGTSIMGEHNIPVIGYGPGELKYAHAPNEQIRKIDLINCVSLYATIPSMYVNTLK